MIIDEKLYIVSLPRTGTKTMCRMLDILGYKSKHAPSAFLERSINEGYNVFADTPVFTLTNVRKNSYDEKNKFIYIERNVDEWISSIESVKLNKGYEFSMNLTQAVQMNVVRLVDVESYGQTFGYYKNYDKQRFVDGFLKHREQILQILNSKNCLFYEFKHGWEPICKFLGKEIENLPEIPHLNKNTMFDNS